MRATLRAQMTECKSGDESRASHEGLAKDPDSPGALGSHEKLLSRRGTWSDSGFSRSMLKALQGLGGEWHWLKNTHGPSMNPAFGVGQIWVQILAR